MKNFLFSVFAFAFLLSCQSDEGEVDFQVTDPEAVKYKVTFTFNWSAQNFPQNYPSNAHFSKLIGWSHNTSSTFFDVGTMATNGIKSMAETGSTSALRSELETRVNNEEGLDFVIGSGLSTGTGDIVVEIDVNKENPLVTLSTMIAPSPDWYVAIVDANLYENDSFVEQKTFEANSYDAGTDSGTSYTSANQATNPRETISKITTAPLLSDVAIATVKFEKI